MWRVIELVALVHKLDNETIPLNIPSWVKFIIKFNCNKNEKL